MAKYWRNIVVLGTVSSHFHIVRTCDSHHTKGEPWNSLKMAVNVLKITASVPPPSYRFHISNKKNIILTVQNLNIKVWTDVFESNIA